VSPKVVIYEQAGFYLLIDSAGKKGNRQMFSNLGYEDAVDGISVDKEHIERTLDYLVNLSLDVPITWFLPRIEPHINNKIVLKRGCEYDWKIRPGLKEIFMNLDNYITNAVKQRNNDRVKTVSQNEIFDFHFPSDFLSCNDRYWDDGDHLSSSGELRFGKRLPSRFLDF
jgi:hypothetical protein